MADRVDWFFRQQVTQAEMDTADDDLEQADRDMVVDMLGEGFITDGPNPATVEENTVPDLFVRANQFKGYDQLGRRLSNLRSGFLSGVNLGAPPPQVVNLAVDELGAVTSVVGGANEKTISIFIEFTRNQQDPRTDGNGSPIFHDQDESIKFNIVQSPEVSLGTSVPPPLRADQLLLADVLLVFAQTAILNADIDQTRREGFTLTLLHGPSHVETGSDPVPNATPSVGGLFSAADKTRHDNLPETVTEVSDLFDNQAKAFQPANFTAPSATTLDVTGLLVAETPGGSASVEGVVTDPPDNRVQIKDTDFDDLLDGSGNKVFGRVTEAASVFTLSFFSFSGGTENAFDMTPVSGTAFQWFVQKAFSLENLPVFDPAFSIPSDQVAGTVPDGSETVKGKVQFAADLDTAALEAVQGNDARLASPIQAKDAGGAAIGGRYILIKEDGGITLTDLGSGELGIKADPPVLVGMKVATSSANPSGGDIPHDNTIPQISEGAQGISLAYTPKNTANRLRIRCEGFANTTVQRNVIFALFEAGSTDAIGTACKFDNPDHTFFYAVNADISVNDVGAGSPVTFSMRFGAATIGSGLTLGQAENEGGGGLGARYGASRNSAILTIEEYTPSA